MTRMAQVALADGTGRRTCWVPLDRQPKVGNRITLKNSEDPERRWSILSMSEPKDSSDLHTDWRVGGL